MGEFTIQVSAATNPVATDKYYRHSFYFSTAAAGDWSIDIEALVETSTWAKVATTLSLSANTSDSVFVTGVFDDLRAVCTRTGGTLQAWYQQDGDNAAVQAS